MFQKTLLLCFVVVTSAAQETRLLRQPDISNNQIVFAYANDLWIVGKTGGNASRLTSYQGSESNAKFSPDGTTIS